MTKKSAPLTERGTANKQDSIITDHRIEFRIAMAEHGLIVRDLPIDDGSIHRVHVEGDKPGSRNGWYVLYSDGMPAGAFGSWKAGCTISWCARSLHSLSAAEQAEHEARIRQIRQARADEIRTRRQRAREYAGRLWNAASPAETSHPYLIRKQVSAHGLKQSGEALLVPLRDAAGQLWNVQRIYPDGTKRFLKGGRITACFHLIGELRSGRVYVAEGFATAATIYMQSGTPVVAAMNAGNLKPVCLAINRSDIELVVAADNDHQTPGNPGLSKGREAAAAVGAGLTWPTGCGSMCTCTDFNDHARCRMRGVAA